MPEAACPPHGKVSWARMGCLDWPLVRELATEIPAHLVDWVTSEWTSQQIEQLPAGPITADALLADTGSCVVHCSTAQERLMCYLPPRELSLPGSTSSPRICRPLGDRFQGLRGEGFCGEIVLITVPAAHPTSKRF